MDTLRLVGGAVVAYLGVALLLGAATLLPDAVVAIASFAAANATEPVVVLNAVLVCAVGGVLVLARRR